MADLLERDDPIGHLGKIAKRKLGDRMPIVTLEGERAWSQSHYVVTKGQVRYVPGSAQKLASPRTFAKRK